MDDNFDEFDEFKNFDRSKLNRLFNDNMSDDEFRDSLKGLIGNYSRDYENFIKYLLGLGNDNQEMDKENFLTRLDINAEDLEDNYLKRLKGESDSIRFMTFTFGPKGLNLDSDYTDRGNIKVEVTDDSHVLVDLNKQLDEAISVEDYEKAAEIRDFIKSFNESDDNKKENKDG